MINTPTTTKLDTNGSSRGGLRITLVDSSTNKLFFLFSHCRSRVRVSKYKLIRPYLGSVDI